MVGMPYLILGVIGTLVYRSYQTALKKARAEAAAAGRPVENMAPASPLMG
jgi:hypothetical protein